MQQRPVLKDLFTASWMAAIVAGGLAFMVIDIQVPAHTSALVYSSFVSVRFFLQCMINLAIILVFMNLRTGTLDRSRRWRGLLLTYAIAIVWAFCCSPLEMALSGQNAHSNIWTQLPSTIVQGILNNSLVCATHGFIILRHENLDAQMENAKLKAAHLEATNLLLRQQMHPHFLFNSLTILKSLYRGDVKGGEEYLVHLVNFLRASLADPATKLTTLQKELKICVDYLEMQRIRFDAALIYAIDVPEEIAKNGCVPPFSLQSLVENAIKHNEVTEEQPLKIDISFCDGYVVTANNLQLRNHPESPASGRGLINLTERYRILSGDELNIRQDGQRFSVGIKILSHEDRNHRG